LFNLWVSLKALGHPNVDEAITTYKNNGLLVPEQVGPINWWNGGYTSWYTPLHHTDIINMIKPILTESLPMLINIIYYPPHSYVYPPFEFSIPYGYNDSFC
ncbi:hypothetical protein KKJ23_24875, partial [Xenorhabdus bovienii]|nr:hypothetical protein [Xenorhabdus bovienii]